MKLTVIQTLIIILAITVGTQISRWLPFLAFSGKKETPPFIKYLGRVLPPALMGLLVVLAVLLAYQFITADLQAFIYFQF